MRLFFGLYADYWDYFLDYCLDYIFSLWLFWLYFLDYSDYISDYMDCMSLIISKQHSPLLLWMESLLISITHQLDSLTSKVREKLPVVLPDAASVPHHYCHLRRFRWPSNEPWNRLPDAVCQLVGTGMVPWYLIRAEDTNLSH